MSNIFKGRRFLLLLIDLSCLAFTFFGLFVLAFIKEENVSELTFLYIKTFAIFAAVIFSFRVFTGVYNNVWRYANEKAYLHLFASDLAGGAVAIALTNFVFEGIDLYESIIAIFALSFSTSVLRLVYQLINKLAPDEKFTQSLKKNINNKIGVAIVGAGNTGVNLVQELQRNDSHYNPLFFIEKDNEKIGRKICGLKVYPSNEKIIDLIRSMPVQEIFIALPNITSDLATEMLEMYRKTGCKVKLYDFPMKDNMEIAANGKRVVREFQIEDLLFRKPLNIQTEKAKVYYKDKVVLVTGGGGSIGSELCRQLAKCSPKTLIIFDIYENNAYEIQQELIATYKNTYKKELDLKVVIGSVRDRARLETVFRKYRPDVVFHAAAHKHVPLMENNACEAVKNNIIGTYNTADMAEKYGVKKFILISTDKAVNPTNIMGATKRVCEMIVQSRTESVTTFAAVRFGNVLGSNGSVIPLFKKQIEAGGPVTVTDKRIIRYFMSISEASQLVMSAGAMAKNGELFVLDMGRPVKIIDLAENMIKLMGFKPYEDIMIEEIGLRKGEKLYEELLMENENLSKTEDDMIFIEKDTPLSKAEIDEIIRRLEEAVEAYEKSDDKNIIKKTLMWAVKTYHEPIEVNSKAYESEEMKMVFENEDSDLPVAAMNI